MNQTFSRTQVFTVYNRAVKASKLGKLPRAKVNRALGILLKTGELDRIEKLYRSTVRSCGCPDRVYTHETCKHMIAEMIKTRIEEL